MDPSDRVVTISEAAHATGLSRKAVERRIERGSIRSVLQANRRLVPVTELRRVGLLGPPPGMPTGRNGDTEPSGPSAGELLERLERLAAENGRLRALSEQTESTKGQLEAELHQLRAQVQELEAQQSQPRRWWTRRRQTAQA